MLKMMGNKKVAKIWKTPKDGRNLKIHVRKVRIKAEKDQKHKLRLKNINHEGKHGQSIQIK